MAGILQASTPSGTNTRKRDWANTETPMPREAPVNQARDRTHDNRPPLVELVKLESSSNVYSIIHSGKAEFTISTSDDEENAIPLTPGANLAYRLQQVLQFIGPGESLADALRAELARRIFEPGLCLATPRAPGYGLRFARLPGVYQTENRYTRFRSKLIATLLDEPIEDGVTHPGEALIDEALRADSSDCQDWLSQLLAEQYTTRPSLCASIVRCIGRLDYDRVRGWGMRVIDDALQNADAEVREAAIRALEAWGRPEALEMLRRHDDAEAWLNEYVQQVIIDLSGTTS